MQPDLVPDAGFTAIAEGVWVARYSSYDLNVGLVAGSRGLVLIDSRESGTAAAQLLDDVRRVADPADLVAVVNTHDHHDHVLGNPHLLATYPGLEAICHEGALDGTPGTPTTFSSVRGLDLGDRALELIHPGPAHTGGDVVVSVPDAHVLFAGDLVEESAPPSFGTDSHPTGWPTALDFVLQLIGPDTVVVPGHGSLVDTEFVAAQRTDLGIVAQTITDLASRGVTEAEAFDAAAWPFGEETARAAIRAGYAHLPRQGRRLPLA